MFQCRVRINSAWKKKKRINSAWNFCHMQLIPTNAIKAICFVMIKGNIVNGLGFTTAWISALELTRPHLIHCGKDTINRSQMTALNFLLLTASKTIWFLIHDLSCNILLPEKLAQLTKARSRSAQYIFFLL